MQSISSLIYISVLLIAFGQGAEAEFIVGGCGSVASDHFEACVALNSPQCRGMTQEQFNQGCCPKGTPVSDKRECAFNQPGSVDCGIISPEKFQGCLSTHAPLCQGITQKQVRDGCCKGGIPVPFKSGCGFSAPNKVDCGLVPPSQFDACVGIYGLACKGMTQNQFLTDCCKTSTPNTSNPICKFTKRGPVDCGTFPPNKFDECASTENPRCYGMTPQQFQKKCCPAGQPQTFQTGCGPN